ncbi:MAG: 50S ribosomal protein L29 [Chromatiaceae bacterium]|nr:MAG: 50S ribosomal protein L29 [Chromatiaceae bacterium]
MKAHELRALADTELASRMQELLKEQFNLRMQKGAGQLARPARVKAVRRDIARIKTLMTERKAGGQQ